MEVYRDRGKVYAVLDPFEAEVLLSAARALLAAGDDPASVDLVAPAGRGLELEPLFEEYARELARGSADPKHRLETILNLRRIAAKIGPGVTLERWTTAEIAAAIGKVWKPDQARAQNKGRQAANQFSNWLATLQPPRLLGNPVSAVRKVREVEKTRVRRFTALELRRLVECPRIAIERRACYATMAVTGLRPGEAGKRRPEDLTLTEPGKIRVPAVDAKDRTWDVLPLASFAVRLIREHLAALKEPVTGHDERRRRDPRLFIVPTLRTFEDDLERAGLERETTSGVLQRKSLRRTFARLLRELAVEKGLIQRLMRHEEEALTDHYIGEIDELPAAIEAVEALGRCVETATPKKSTTARRNRDRRPPPLREGGDWRSP